MLLSVIIPTYNRREALGDCLKLLTPEVQGVSRDVFEVIVTDDALADNPADSLLQEFPWVRHNRGPQKGPAANRNSGAKAALGDWLIFMDDDCLPQASFLSAYIEAIRQHPEYRVFEGRTLTDRPQQRMDEEAPHNDKGGYLWSCNFLVEKKTFSDMGGFCELYPYACMEDVDFREQLIIRNLGFLFVPEATVLHPWRPISPDAKYLKIRLVSHEVFLDRYPHLRPSFGKVFWTNCREWVRLLFVDGPSLKYRGFWRFLARHMTATLLQFLIWSGLSRTTKSPAS